jgi:hypothetical protein
MVFTIIATSCLVYPSSENSLSENLAITLDKKIYQPGDEARITVTNLTDNTIRFYTWECELELERWNGATWENFVTWYQKQSSRDLGPHENVVVTLGLSEMYFHSGEYRVGTRGVYAEFEVQESRTWIVFLIAAIVIVGIAVAYLVIRRKRGQTLL